MTYNQPIGLENILDVEGEKVRATQGSASMTVAARAGGSKRCHPNLNGPLERGNMQPFDESSLGRIIFALKCLALPAL